MNKVILIGRLTKDPVVTTLSNGIKRAVINVATDGYGKDSPSDFHKVTAFRQTAEFLEKYIKKGDQILIEGSNRSGKFTDKDGKDVYTYEVIADIVEGLSRSSAKQVDHHGADKPAQEPKPVQNKQAEVPWDLDL